MSRATQMNEVEASQELTAEERHHLLCVECFVHAKLRSGGVLVVGPPKCGKSTFGRYFALEAAKYARPVVYVAVDEPPSETLQALEEVIPDPALRRMVRVVDCFSWRTGRPPSGEYPYASPKNLTEFSLTLDKIAKSSENQCLILDSLTSVALDAGPDPTRSFIQALLARMKAYNMLCLSTLGKGIHKEDYEQVLRFMFDGIVELKVEEQDGEVRRLIRIYALKGAQPSTAWHQFIATTKGFSFPEQSYVDHAKYHFKQLLTKA